MATSTQKRKAYGRSRIAFSRSSVATSRFKPGFRLNSIFLQLKKTMRSAVPMKTAASAPLAMLATMMIDGEKRESGEASRCRRRG